MPRSVTVVLGEREHTIHQLRRRESSGWRKALQAPVEELLGPVMTVLNAPDVELSDAEGLRNLGRAVVPFLTESVDRCADMLVAYAPNLREAVDEAYDDEIIAAFVEVLKLAFPFGGLRGMFSAGSGSATPRTSPSSASANGDAGTTS